jgi:amidase
MDATELAFAGAARQARLVAAGEVSSRELVEAVLTRIERLDPVLNAFRVVYAERALLEADQADARRRAGEKRALLGVPVAVKDDVDLAGDVTAWGTAAHGGPAARDADVVARLRAAGAVIVGKTNVPELTIWPFTESLTFGATRNPWALDRSPGGSSGGSGAAVAAGLCGVALGSDGAGSIRIPSAFCGLFGLKPTRDRISLGPGHVDAWHGLSVNGPLARTVADAALFLDATADGAPAGGYALAAAQAPERLRVGLATNAPPGLIARLGTEQRRALEDTVALLRSLGHDVGEVQLDYGPRAATSILSRYLRGIHDDAATLPHPERLERRTRAMARLGAAFGDGAIRRIRAGENALRARIGGVFEQVDVLLMPGPAGPPFRVGELHGRGALWTLEAAGAKVPWYGIWNALGQPAASVPAGFDHHGLPLAVQLAAPRDGENLLLALSAQVEAARPWADRRPPVG